MNSSKRLRLATLASITIIALTAISLAPAVYAVGPDWHASLSNTYHSPGDQSGSGGMKETCNFAGGAGSPATSGNLANCEMELFFGLHHEIQAHFSINGTAWDMELATIRPLGLGIPNDDFYMTAGTMSVTVPQTASLPVPPGATQYCTHHGNTVTCPLFFWESQGMYNPDTGIPGGAGHYNLNFTLKDMGDVGDLQIQVTQLS